MKNKLLFVAVLALFYVVTQQNFTSATVGGKRSCDDIKISSKQCASLLENYQNKIKFIQTTYKTGSLDYTVNTTAENSSFIEKYKEIAREKPEVSKEDGRRAPASICLIEETPALVKCLEETKKIYENLVPSEAPAATAERVDSSKPTPTKN